MGKVHYQLITTYYKLMRILRAAGMNPTPQQLRAAVDKLALMNPLPRTAEMEKTELGGVPAWYVHQRKRNASKLFFVIHGGGFVFGSFLTHRAMIAYLNRLTGYEAYAPEYRLAPEHPFPIPLEDCYSAYTAMVERHPDASIAILGDSAGGNLAASLVVLLRERGHRLPDHLVLFSPWMDLSPESQSVLKNRNEDSLFDKDDLVHYSALYLAGQSAEMPQCSPLRADLEGFPPTLIQVAGNELLYYDSEEFAERLKAAGVRTVCSVYPLLFHVWQLFPHLVPEAKQALDEVAEFVLAPSNESQCTVSKD
ncbi:MAG: hypothetical protein RL226_772 [Bacteroidota bacterium]|jgi:acetyl esterase/lipase